MIDDVLFMIKDKVPCQEYKSFANLILIQIAIGTLCTTPSLTRGAVNGFEFYLTKRFTFTLNSS
jgi:hypothetical protein